MRTLMVAVLSVAIAGWTWVAAQQREGAGHQAATGAHSQSSSEIFCAARSAGQLCGHGTIDVLRLSGAKQEAWTRAVRQYNSTVDAATKELLQEAKAILSPEESALVEKWFDKSVNAEMNRILLAAH